MVYFSLEGGLNTSNSTNSFTLDGGDSPTRLAANSSSNFTPLSPSAAGAVAPLYLKHIVDAVCKYHLKNRSEVTK
jgi:hypothetical protein